MKRSILLISGNYSPEPTGIGKYNKEMTDWMADNGFEVTVISTYPYYPYWQLQAPYTRRHKWYSKERLITANGNVITVYRCPHYVPKKPTGARRMMLDFSFALAAFFQVLKLAAGKKFQYVITVIPPLPLGLLSVLYKKLRNATFLYHVQDLQIEAARDLQMIQSQRTIRNLFRIEQYILRHADIVSSISDGMIEKMQEKTTKPVVFFPNWADLHQFYPISDKGALKQAFGFATTDKVVLYSGSVGEKQGLEAILDAAAKEQNPAVKFVICGSGPYKEKLQQMAVCRKLDNVVFMPLQPLDQFNNFLNMADVHLIIQKANASDLVMPSKLTNILAVGGLALVTANANSTLHKLISKHKMGLLVPAEDAPALQQGIACALSQPMAAVQANALAYARQHLAIDEVMKTYFNHTLAPINLTVEQVAIKRKTVMSYFFNA
ncbi:colanic acid biosynthesis glycosyltransferase WcaI [Ilyomonas limi]|uniref:Colanic acid biosynthesis glycosyltransferase WcaI n=1 Tax=Ilyomonas limi TaxID=2575867 RepID=A0A4U3L1W4_9BACT|nr:WcaI family glycosyltransferase [Ilyomonas limi]TKK68204.1 colanic acid biosynthesis glycosyltransferase WcaI [Ilyomonas limi]